MPTKRNTQMRALWMALLTAVMMTGCGDSEEQQSRSPASPRMSRAALEDPGLRGRGWDAPLRGVLAAGSGHSLALDADGTLWAWGYNPMGQLGDGTLRNRSLPVKVVGLDRVKSVVAGPLHTLALREDGTVWSWGDNMRAQLGRPITPFFDLVPVRVPGLTGVVALSAHWEYSLALREDGTVWAWGSNASGQLGRPESYGANPTPEQVAGLTGVVALSAGESHVLALREDGTVWSWGSNFFGELGRTTGFISDFTPAPVPGLERVAGLAASGGFSLALREDGTVWSWGHNFSGQLGDGTTSGRHTPRQV